MAARPLRLGADPSSGAPVDLPPHHLTTHGVVVGMTGSGKTGLVVGLVEEALRSRVPVLVIDVKGDLPNLLLAFPELAPASFAPWIDPAQAERAGKSTDALAAELAAAWAKGLAGAGLSAADVAAYRASIAPRLLTPGLGSAAPVHLLSALEAGPERWDEDEEVAREYLSAAVSLLLRLVERDPDPTRSREHVLLALLAERRQRAGQPAGLADLLRDLASPPIATVGAMETDEFLPPKERLALSQQLNALLASPTFAAWRTGEPLDVGAWMTPPAPGRTPVAILSVAHLDDDERQLVLGLALEGLLSWVRGLAGTSELRALVVFDEVFGFLPPHPANPPTKRPLLALLKQARAFGVGVVIATQNPMDLDYKALSNAGAWFLGRLQTDADRERVVEGLLGAGGGGEGQDAEALGGLLRSLPPRTFFVRDVHAKPATFSLSTRFTMSWLRGPMTRKEVVKLAREISPPGARDAGAAAGAPPPTAPAAGPPAAPAPVAAAPAGALAAPAAPHGWGTHFAHVPDPTAKVRYVPWILGTVVVHATAPKTELSRTVTRWVAMPLTGAGTADPTRAQDLPPAALTPQAAPGVPFAALPAALARKASAQAIERALRDHALRTTEVTVEVVDALGLAREEGETPEAFLARCREALARQGGAAANQLVAEYAPKVAKLQNRVQALEARAAAAEAGLHAAPGAMGEVLVGIAFGRSAGRSAASQRTKAQAKLDKAQQELFEARQALTELVAERDARIRQAAGPAAHAGVVVGTKTLLAKKGGASVGEIAIAWAIEPG